MNEPQPKQSARDKLVTRPEEALPSVEDPKKPRGEPADPKEIAPEGQGNDPHAGDLGHTV